MAVTIVTLLVATAIIGAENAIQSGGSTREEDVLALDNNRLRAVPMSTPGNNLYMAWPNNDTGQYNVFFARSTTVARHSKHDDKCAQ